MLTRFFNLINSYQPSGVVVRGAYCYTKGLGFKSRIRHKCQTVCPRSHHWLSSSVLKICRQEVPCSILGHTCQPSHSKFSLVFLKSCINIGQDPLEKSPSTYMPRFLMRPLTLKTNNNDNLINQLNFIVILINFWPERLS